MLPFRRAAFIPVNLPMFLGMVATPQTLPWISMWQVLNQSYNVAMNYTNRNGSHSMSNSTLAVTYLVACGASTGAAMGVKLLASRWQNMAWAQTLAGRAFSVAIVPLAGVVGAGTINCLYTRRHEITLGVEVYDKQGTTLGTSKLAGRDAVVQTLLSRALLPIPSLFVPPFVMNVVDRKWPIRNPRWRLLLQTCVVLAMLAISLPLSLAPFQLIITRDATALEPEFHDRTDASGKSIQQVYYARGM